MGIPAGTVLSKRYRVVRPIGSGGMGEVYEAEKTSRAGGRVAVKVLADHDARSLARFEREARALARLTHPNVVSVVDVHLDDEHPLIAMELLEGESLVHVLARERTLRIDRAVRIACEMLDALEAAHEVGIIHRDVKPSNVFLVRDSNGAEHVKIVDFGIAKDVKESSPKTTTGAIVGTPSYLAPEQLMGEPADARTDVRAVGVCLFEMLAGCKPWKTKSAAEVSTEILREDARTLADAGATVPAEIDDIVHRALAREPAERFPDAASMREELRAVPGMQRAPATIPAPALAEDPPRNMEAERPRPPRSVLVLCALVAVALIVAIALAMRP